MSKNIVLADEQDASRQNLAPKVLIERENSEMLRIGDIYAGKPDAGDEIKECGYEEFANIFIRPTGVNIDRLACAKYGTPIFVMGDKGTGKTALLYYLEKYVCSIDHSACTSFISFERDFPTNQRDRMEIISKSLSTSVTIDSSITSKGENVECDFSCIWRWQLYQKLIDDNNKFNGGLFVDDDSWNKFTSEINKIGKTIDKGKMFLPAKITFLATTNQMAGTVTQGIQFEPLDLSQSGFQSTRSYAEFIKVISNADYYFSKVQRTDIPFYIFIDELEAYRGKQPSFYRDLRMIRDLLFTVKNLNGVLKDGTKMICSVRLEILNAINRFVESKQLHKIMQGYDERLTWEHTNTNSFSHPIIGVLLRRIQSAEEKNGSGVIIDKQIIKKWFVPQVYNQHVCTYILDNTWHKPRDIVRMLLAAQSKNSREFFIFNQNTFETFMPAYSKQCLVEVREEMHALYTAEEIESIFSCLQGFKKLFSFDEIKKRAETMFPTSIFAEDTLTVLRDMYRIGVIGNYNLMDKTQRWEHKEQYNLITGNPWQIIIHPSLRIELSVGGRKSRYDENRMRHSKKKEYNTNETYNVVITRIQPHYMIVSFKKNGAPQKGYISMKNMSPDDVVECNLSSKFNIGETLTAQICGYNEKHGDWYMRIKE